MRILSLLLLLLTAPALAFGQDSPPMHSHTLEVSPGDSPLRLWLDFENQSEKIRDGSARARVEGGVAPYTYKWSKNSVPLQSDMARGLSEGRTYQITVTDAQGASLSTSFALEAYSVDERINSFFIPVVDWMATVIMADVFALLGLYDNQIYDDAGTALLHPNGDPVRMSIPFVVVWLVLGASFFTLRMGLINFRGFGHALALVRGDYDKPEDKGEVSHFQALATALSATVGLGNIAGVAIAIGLGGPGATLWMIIAGLLGMTAKFVECTLGVKYRTIDPEDGHVSGGPMYYLARGLKAKGMGRLGKVLSVVFAILVVGGSLGGGNMFQANQAFQQLALKFPALEGFGWAFGIVLAVLVGLVIIGGIQSIAKVTEKMVPFMALLYVGTALVIVGMNFDRAGEAFSLIWYGAFSPEALKGGVIGVLVVGFQRAAFSNEAGVGSAAIAHSAVKTDEPVSEGIVSLLEPFIDTVIICTMTALVIIFTGYYDNPTGLDGVQLTSAAFGTVFSWFPYLLMVAVLLFAISTMISWSYYGVKGFNFLFAKLFKSEKTSSRVYYAIFLIFVVIGTTSSLGAVLDFSDMMILSMAFPNVLGLLLLSGEVRRDLRSYMARVKSGEIKRYK